MPRDAKDLVDLLLQKEPSRRLGAGPPGSRNDFEWLRAHPFFDGLNFFKLNEEPVPIDPPVERVNKELAEFRPSIKLKPKLQVDL